MKPLSVLVFAVLSVVAYAETTALRPLDPLASPPSIPIAPRLPLQEDEPSHKIVLGQSRSINELAELLGSTPPPAQGAVAEGTIDPKLTGASDPTESDSETLSASTGQSPVQPKVAAVSKPTSPDPLGYAVLLMVTAVTTIGLVIMVFVALDYRQRWMQSSTMQNDRYLGGAFDLEDTYGTYSASPSFSEGFGLTRRSI